MNVQQQIAKLESLLGRIQRNAGKQREAAPPLAKEEARVSAAPPPTARVGVIAAAPAPVFQKPASEPPAELEIVSGEVEEMDMMDAEIVELGGPAGLEPVPGIEADLTETLDEPMPESAPRPALQARAERDDLGEEADLGPVKTPPPESGRQAVVPVSPPTVTIHADEADIDNADVDALLEADTSGGHISKAPPGMPAMEQLGETVELLGADGPTAELELAHVVDHSTAEEATDDLELSLPKQGFSGGYHEELAPPVGARDDLERHRRDAESEVHPPSHVSLVTAPPAAAAVPPPAVAGPVLVNRPATDVVHVAEMITASAPALPSTFAELLDRSLALRAN